MIDRQKKIRIFLPRPTAKRPNRPRFMPVVTGKPLASTDQTKQSLSPTADYVIGTQSMVLLVAVWAQSKKQYQQKLHKLCLESQALSLTIGKNAGISDQAQLCRCIPHDHSLARLLPAAAERDSYGRNQAIIHCHTQSVVLFF